MANAITICRILCSIFLIFTKPFSLPFYSFYLIAGLSDMIDGTIARKTDTVSEFGSKLDTIADSLFFAVCIIKLLPVMRLSFRILAWISVIAVLKIISIILYLIYNITFDQIHNVLNKITGLMLFIFPMTLPFIDLRYSSIVICITATAAAIQEIMSICKFRNENNNA